MTIKEILQQLKLYIGANTVTRDEVLSLISNITGGFVVVDTLPTASVNTLNKIYLVPDGGSDDTKDMWVTIDNGASANPRYTWDRIGSTTVDLTDYALKTTVPNTTVLDENKVTFVHTEGGVTTTLFDLNKASNVAAGLLSKDMYSAIAEIIAHIGDGSNLASMSYVDEEDIILQQALIELREELESLAEDTYSKSETYSQDEINAMLVGIDPANLPSSVDHTSEVVKFKNQNDVEIEGLQINHATASLAGVMTAADKKNLDDIKAAFPSTASENNKLATEGYVGTEIGARIATTATNGWLSHRFATKDSESVVWCTANLQDCIMVFNDNNGPTEILLPHPQGCAGKFYMISDKTTGGGSHYVRVYDHAAEIGKLGNNDAPTDAISMTNDATIFFSDGARWNTLGMW